MRKFMLMAVVSVCLLITHAQAIPDITLESDVFTLLSGKRLFTGKGVQINGWIGAASDIHLGKGTQIEGDVYTNGQFKSAPLSSITGRLVANSDIKIASRAQINTLDSGSNVKIGKKAIVFGNINIADLGNLQLHPQAIALGDILLGNDSWAATSLPAPIATSFLPANTLEDFIVAKDGADDLDPGQYADLKLKKNATLILTAGTYFFDQIKLGKLSTLITDTSDGPVIINVANKMKSSSRVTIEKEGTGEVLFTVLGKTKFGSRNNLFTNIIVRNKLKIGNDSNLTGTYYSESDLRVGKQVVVNGLSQAAPAVPEPATVVLLTLGGTALLARKRRRRAAA